MSYLIIGLALILVVFGIIFSVLPPLPGPVLSYSGMLLLHFVSPEVTFSKLTLIIWAGLVVAVLVADYALPIVATKSFGGTKSGIWGGIIGTVAGVVLPIPFGIIIGPLVGAVIGDLVGGNRLKLALKSGFGSFLGFVLATSLKIFVAVGVGVAVLWKVGTYAYDLFF